MLPPGRPTTHTRRRIDQGPAGDRGVLERRHRPGSVLGQLRGASRRAAGRTAGRDWALPRCGRIGATEGEIRTRYLPPAPSTSHRRDVAASRRCPRSRRTAPLGLKSTRRNEMNTKQRLPLTLIVLVVLTSSFVVHAAAGAASHVGIARQAAAANPLPFKGTLDGRHISRTPLDPPF